MLRSARDEPSSRLVHGVDKVRLVELDRLQRAAARQRRRRRSSCIRVELVRLQRLRARGQELRGRGLQCLHRDPLRIVRLPRVEWRWWRWWWRRRRRRLWLWLFFGRRRGRDALLLTSACEACSEGEREQKERRDHDQGARSDVHDFVGHATSFVRLARVAPPPATARNRSPGSRRRGGNRSPRSRRREESTARASFWPARSLP